MTKRGRPPKAAETVRFRIHLSLTRGIHDDLIAWLQGLPARRRARAVLDVLLTGDRPELQAHEADNEIVEELEFMLF